MSQLTDKVASIVIQGVYNGQADQNSFYIQTAEAITSAILEEIAGRVATWVATTQLPLLSSEYQHERIVVTDQTTSPGLQVINSDNAGNAGGITGDKTPNNVTFAVHRNTGMSGKAAKSRIYWPAFVEGFMSTANNVNVTTANDFVDALETLRLSLESAGITTYQYGYISRVLDGVLRAAGLFVPVIGHSYTDLFTDSLRRRLPGRGV